MKKPQEPRRVFTVLGADWSGRLPRIVGLVRTVQEDETEEKGDDGQDGPEESVG